MSERHFPASSHISSRMRMRWDAHHTVQAALNLPYLWCERRSIPEPLQPTRWLFSASSSREIQSGKGEGPQRPLSSSLFLFPALFSPLSSRLLEALSRAGSFLSLGAAWKQFTNMWDKTGCVVECKKKKKKKDTGYSQRTSPRLTARRSEGLRVDSGGSSQRGFCWDGTRERRTPGPHRATSQGGERWIQAPFFHPLALSRSLILHPTIFPPPIPCLLSSLQSWGCKK